MLNCYINYQFIYLASEPYIYDIWTVFQNIYNSNFGIPTIFVKFYSAEAYRLKYLAVYHMPRRKHRK